MIHNLLIRLPSVKIVASLFLSTIPHAVIVLLLYIVQRIISSIVLFQVFRKDVRIIAGNHLSIMFSLRFSLILYPNTAYL